MKEYQAPKVEVIKYLSEDIFLSGEGDSTVSTDPDGYIEHIFNP